MQSLVCGPRRELKGKLRAASCELRVEFAALQQCGWRCGYYAAYTVISLFASGTDWFRALVPQAVPNVFFQRCNDLVLHWQLYNSMQLVWGELRTAEEEEWKTMAAEAASKGVEGFGDDVGMDVTETAPSPSQVTTKHVQVVFYMRGQPTWCKGRILAQDANRMTVRFSDGNCDVPFNPPGLWRHCAVTAPNRERSNNPEHF